jgi:hypothetical protein
MLLLEGMTGGDVIGCGMDVVVVWSLHP